ncbi:MAG TPA: agmatine deiminase family protein [Gammaproteobacteria bacterium]|nr:agmatine deiminase family protein [Gammaproteobacteria bacterium]
MSNPKMKDPRDLGLFMPGEWEKHTCCWMAWPARVDLWPNIEATKKAYADVANTIAEFEPVNLLVLPSMLDDARAYLSKNVEIIEMSIDDSWTRDSGPNFLINDSGLLAGSTWEFNAWGDKFRPYDQDALMGSRILDWVGVDEYTSTMIAEGGGITVDGEGTVITTESCFPNKNRNPHLAKKEIESELCRTLGASKVIWIPGDPNETGTDGHIDGIAAFIEPGRILVEISPDSSDPHYRVGQNNVKALKNIKDAKGRTLEIDFIYEGDYSVLEFDECRSYINSYLANGAVIVPGYNHERDLLAVETYQKIYPDREVVQIQISDIAIGGGGIHCITQQQPNITNY